MIEIRLGDRYAKSIYELAVELKQVDAVRDDFILIDSVCMQNRDFRLLLSSPIVHVGKKKAIIRQIFEGKLSEVTANLLEIILRKHREKYLHDIAQRYLALYDKRHNIIRGKIVSATPLQPEQRQAIIDLVKSELKTDFRLTEEVDPELIGGFRLLVGDRLFDGSIATRLRELQQEFKNNPYVK